MFVKVLQNAILISSNVLSIKECQVQCIENCRVTPGLMEYQCTGLCLNHCLNYENVIDNQKVKCLLLCANLNLEKSVCNAVCKPYLASSDHKIEDQNVAPSTDYNQGCVGYGREVCYKACRLYEKQSINICLCACCKCRF